MESDNDCLQGLLLAPMVSRGSLSRKKSPETSHSPIVAEMIILPIFAVLQHLSSI